MTTNFTLAANTGMVLGDDDPVEGIAHAAALGLEAVEFFDIEGADRTAVREASEAHGVDIAASLTVGVAANVGADGDSITDPSLHEEAVADVERSLEMGQELGAETLIVTVGPERDDLPPGAEHRAIVNVLKDAAPAAEDAGITLVLEPLNNPVDHQGYYLDSSYEAYEIVDAVDSPRVKVLYDIYHQQITEGNVIDNVREHAEFIGHYHVADVPGRHEPGTGEINYANVFDAIEETGYDGYVGLEFSPSGDPDEAVEGVVSLAE
ncbi:hydroxypyruvate isomerase family protein [Halomontanus rarus]|uniref:hydroxypyruvate isomerase family protein n=1 Tax=Halomontanus rarus TaxID=3034020 RepID=UPI0023E81597|nr:TIM barrel protein [Halovivax sp. TS33]